MREILRVFRYCFRRGLVVCPWRSSTKHPSPLTRRHVEVAAQCLRAIFKLQINFQNSIHMSDHWILTGPALSVDGLVIFDGPLGLCWYWLHGIRESRVDSAGIGVLALLMDTF